MRTSTHTTLDWQPEQTPTTIARIIAVTATLTIISGLFDNFLAGLFGTNLSDIFALSWNGLESFRLWQPFSYNFIESNNGAALTFWNLISLAFQMYILWMCGSNICHQVGEKSFLRFYILTGALSGMLALLTIPTVYAFSTISGPSAALFALFTVWVLFNPELELLLFFVMSVKSKWLLAFVGVSVIIVNGSQGDFTALAWHASAIVIAYLWGVLAWDLTSPYPQFWGLDKKINTIGTYIKRKFKSLQKKPPKEQNGTAKIFDIQTGEALLDDEQFVDAMLTKISKYGETALSWLERKRLDKISKQKVEKNRNEKPLNHDHDDNENSVT